MVKKSIFICLLILLTASSRACDRSSLTLTDVSYDGSLYTLELTLAFGGGVFGVDAGGIGATGAFFIGTFPLAGETISLTNYSPASITGTGTVCGGNFIEPGPNPIAPLGILANIQGCNLTCVNSTVLCGLPFTEEFTISLTLTGLPESIQCFGIEGSGNPYAGCTGDPDMIVFPNSFLSLEWGASGVRQNSTSTVLHWSTLSETETYKFEVEKTYDGKVFFPLGSIPAAHYSTTEQFYEVEFERELIDVYYRVTMINANGSRDVGKLNFAPRLVVDQPKYYPNPSSGDLRVIFLGDFELVVYDMFGRALLSLAGSEYLELDLSHLSPGTYQLMVSNGSDYFTQPWVKLN